MSNFCFSHNVFKNCPLLMSQNEYLRSKGLQNPRMSKNTHATVCHCDRTIMAIVRVIVKNLISVKILMEKGSASSERIEFWGKGR